MGVGVDIVCLAGFGVCVEDEIDAAVLLYMCQLMPLQIVLRGDVPLQPMPCNGKPKHQ